MDDQNGQQKAGRKQSVAEMRSMWDANASSNVPRTRVWTTGKLPRGGANTGGRKYSAATPTLSPTIREVSIKDQDALKLSTTRMDIETISATPSEIKALTEINISQSTPTEEKEATGCLSNKPKVNTNHDTVLSPEVIMRNDSRLTNRRNSPIFTAPIFGGPGDSIEAKGSSSKILSPVVSFVFDPESSSDGEYSEEENEYPENLIEPYSSKNRTEMGHKYRLETTEDTVCWALNSLEDLLLALAQDDDETEDESWESQTSSKIILDTTSEPSINSVTNNKRLKDDQIVSKSSFYNKINNTMELRVRNNKNKIGIETGQSFVPRKTSGTNESKLMDNTNEQSADSSNVVPYDTGSNSKVGQNIQHICDIFKESLSEKDLNNIMGKIRPIFHEISESYKLELSKYNQQHSSTAISSLSPAVSAPPPPAPPPPPPPSQLTPKFHVKKKGAILTANKNATTGDISKIEIRINNKPKDDDMMGQLQKRLQDRRKRTTLAVKLAKLQ